MKTSLFNLPKRAKRYAVAGILAPILLAVTGCETSGQSAVGGAVLGSLVPYANTAGGAAALSAGSAAAYTTADIQASQGQ